MIFVPFAVPAALASRHSPDCTPVIVPFEFTFHCWLVWPLQSQMMTAVPLVVPLPFASRHLLPYTVSCLLEVDVQSWLLPPQQSYNCTWVPLVVEAFGTSTHRPGCPPTISLPLLPPPVEVPYPAATMLACTEFSVAS